MTHAWRNYADQRESALQSIDSDWIFFIDADERSSPAQATEIRAAIATNPQIVGCWLPRHNYIVGHLTRHAGWYPDYQLRVLRRDKARYDLTRAVHELVLLDGESVQLTTPLIHYNYQDWRQFHDKQRRYTRYAAETLFAQGVHVKPQNYILQPLRQFWWRFVTLAGWRDGWHGFRLSVLMGWYEWRKYVALGQCWRRAARSSA